MNKKIKKNFFPRLFQNCFVGVVPLTRFEVASSPTAWEMHGSCSSEHEGCGWVPC